MADTPVDTTPTTDSAAPVPVDDATPPSPKVVADDSNSDDHYRGHVSVDLPAVSGEHALQTPWTIWYDKKPNRTSIVAANAHDSAASYECSLRKIKSFNSIEGFYRIYCQLHRPLDMPKNTSIHVFRHGTKPMWENYPYGGCWMLKIRKRCVALNALWEKLLFALIGETFSEPAIVGAAVSIRQKEDILSVWCCLKKGQDQANRFRIGDKIRNLFQLESSTILEYKSHETAMKDGSSFRNSKQFVCGVSVDINGNQIDPSTELNYFVESQNAADSQSAASSSSATPVAATAAVAASS